jgi:prolycopene isomerase
MSRMASGGGLAINPDAREEDMGASAPHTGPAGGTAVTEFDWTRATALADGIRSKSDFPTVVIGSGLGGLTVAAYLARCGFPVTVLEQRDEPGGYAVSFERRGYRFEVSPHYGRAIAPVLATLGIGAEVELLELPGGAHIVGETIDLRLPLGEPEGIVRAFVERFPSEAEALRRFFGDLGRLMQEYRTPAVDPASPATTHPLRQQLAGETADIVLSRYFRDPLLRTVLAMATYNFGEPPSALPALLYCLGVGGVLLARGLNFVRHNPLSLAQALAGVIERHGGRIVLGAEVARILTRDGSAVSVRTAGGEEFPARAVVANAAAPQVLGKMLPQDSLPPGYLERVKMSRTSTTTFIVWLGLKESQRERLKGYNHLVLPEGGDWEASYAAVGNGDVTTHGFVALSYDQVAPEYAPPGKGSLSLIMMCRYDPWRRFEADYLAGRKEAYRREKERVADILIGRAEKWVLPGLRGMIEVMETASPLTNQRYTRNPEGAILGYASTPDNFGPKRIGNRTPVGALYLASAWGDPGGGVNPVMSGAQKVFMSLLSEWSGSEKG